MKKLIVLMAMALSYQVASAQIQLIGKVRNAESGEAVSGALVELKVKEVAAVADPEVTSYSAFTDELGTFFFDVPGATYVLNITAIGFDNLSKEVSLSSSTNLNLDLKVSTYGLNSATVSALRAGRFVPTTSSYLGQKQIALLDQSKDFPFLMNGLPSTVVSSDAGNGVGYTGIRIRGIDPTRVNVTINDVPLNDAEGQGVFWVDLPDLASSTGSIQVQRGVGTSTNGGSAFGASVNVQNAQIQRKKFAEAQLAYGSFNTLRTTVQAGTGKMRNGWAFQGRYSYIGSDGFIDRATSELTSTQLTAEKRWKKSKLKANVMLGHERTYQAWWGIPQPKYSGNEKQLDSFIYNLGIQGDDLDNLKNSDPSTYNYYTYENEVDDYTQNHYQLFFTHTINSQSFFKLTGHYTRGLGYFEQYKIGEDLADYGIEPYINGTDTARQADLVRRRWLDNHFYGMIGSYHYQNETIDLTVGASANQYLGRHFGEAIQTAFTDYEALNAVYYDNDAVKNDANGYAKALFSIGKLHPYADIQYRFVNYQFEGPDELGVLTDQSADFLFFNPKIGANYRLLSFIDLRAMYAIGNREPVRNDFVESSPDSRPKAEQVEDLELGIEINTTQYFIGLTIYDMQYKDALVVNGQLNDVGAYSRVNVAESYRKGVEFELLARPSRMINIGGNLTLSENKIANYTEYVDDWFVGGQKEFEYENTDLAFSPSVIATGMVDLILASNLRLSINTKYVGTQYLDNTSSEDRKLDPFQTVNAAFHYQNTKTEYFKRIGISLFLNNITNQRYAPNGYTFSGILDNRQSFNYVYPMAGFNWMLKLNVKI